MCLASSVQYGVCGCYHGHEATSACPRGIPVMDNCPDFSAQGVTRREGYCPACRHKNAQKASHGYGSENDDMLFLRAMMRQVMMGLAGGVPAPRRRTQCTPARSPWCMVFCPLAEAAPTPAKLIRA